MKIMKMKTIMLFVSIIQKLNLSDISEKLDAIYKINYPENLKKKLKKRTFSTPFLFKGIYYPYCHQNIHLTTFNIFYLGRFKCISPSSPEQNIYHHPKYSSIISPISTSVGPFDSATSFCC